MTYVHADEKARICLTTENIQRYGKNYVMIMARDKIILIPVPDDPLKSLQEEGKKIPKNLSIAEIRKMAREEAEKEALKSIRR